MEPIQYALLIWFLSPFFLLIAIWRIRKNLNKKIVASDYQISLSKFQIDEQNIKYSKIIDVDQEVNRLTEIAFALKRNIKNVQDVYIEKRKYLDSLERQVAIYDEKLAFFELGLYDPHFQYSDSEQYKARIIEVRSRQKAMVSAKLATNSPANWLVDNSQAKGETMVNRQIRLTLRAFNNECEASISNVRWNNVGAMEKRILAAVAAIDKENSSLKIVIEPTFAALKLEELFLTHEYREKAKEEKENRTEMARAEREEKKLLAEAEAAEREERRYQNLLDKARKEAELGSFEAQGRIAELEKALADAHSETERARAMAELTKSGYVYIISNIGSFGENVVKIGLTRRLDPDDRIRELGDASVPFAFDTHAMIYSAEAPTLEAILHREFADRRINTSNMRKEFFRVTLEEVEEAVGRLAPTASFFKDREAQDWHETLAKRNIELSKNSVSSRFPDAI